MCDGLLYFSNVVLTPKLDRFHLLRDAYGDVLLRDGRLILTRLPDLRHELLHLLLHSGICHALLRSVLPDFSSNLMSWNVDDRPLNSLSRKNGSSLHNWFLRSRRRKRVVHCARRHVLPGCPHAWPRPQETAAQKNLWFLPQTCGGGRWTSMTS